MKYYLSDDLASHSEDEKQLARARREAAANRKKREANKQRDKKKQFRNAPSQKKISKSLANHTRDTAALGITQNLKKSVLLAEKKGAFSISPQIEETETTVNSERDWEISDKTEEISVRGRLKENSHFWKNELKPSLFVQNVIDNGYIMPLNTIPPSFYAPNNNSSLRNSRFVSQAISKLLKNNCMEELDQKLYCCNTLRVAESRKLRLVLDLRHVISFVKQKNCE